jgi:biotin carboxylase
MSDLNGKKFLLLGGVRNSINIVKRAQELGVHVIVTDYLVDSPAKKRADESYLVSTTNVDSVVELAKSLRVNGVFTAYLDSMLAYCQQVCDKLNLPFYATAEQIEIMTNKDKFKKVCLEHGLKVVKEYRINNEDINEIISDIQYPVIVKPVDSGGSKGIFICDGEKELREKYLEALTYSKSKKVLIEEYMTSEEVVMYYVIQDGYVSLSAMCDRYTNKEQKGVAQIPTAYIFPSKHLPTFKNTDHQRVVNLVKSMNIKNGVLFLQAFMHQGRVCIYEPGFRFAGAQGHTIIKEVTGIDTVEMMIRHSLTGKMEGQQVKDLEKPEFDIWACKLTPIARKGKIVKIEGLDKIANLPEVFDVVDVHDEGDTITQIGTLDQLISRIFIKTKSKNDLARVIEVINATIKVEDEDGRNMLLEPFNPYSF